MNIDAFLETVVSTEAGNFCLLIGDGVNNPYGERWYKWPDQKETIAKEAQEIAKETNVYFATGLFKAHKSTKELLLPSKTISVDLDEADITSLPIEPTVLVETSEERHQGFWILKDELGLDELEILSKRLTYSIEDADRGCWALARKTRLPGTLNWKYVPPHLVSVIGGSQKIYNADELESATIPANELIKPNDDADNEWIRNAHKIDLKVGPLQLLSKYKGKIPSRIGQTYKVGTPEPKGQRSEMLWSLMTSLYRAGASRDEVYWIAKHSTWNKFAANRYNSERDLAKDVWRAEQKSKKEGSGVTALISTARKQPMGSKFERSVFVAQIVRDHMARVGEFLRTESGGELWYLRYDTGKPIKVETHSQNLISLLEQTYGLNASEELQRFVLHHIIAWTRERGKLTDTATMSWHDDLHNQVLIHTGQRDVYVVSPDSVSRTLNGQGGILFTWNNSQSFNIDLEESIGDWAGFMFQESFTNLVGVSQQDAINLMRVWLLFVLMRHSAINRPILTFIGQPGSGKSTTFRMIYALLYGPYRSLDSVTTQDNFDWATITEPLVVLDNVDTWAAWLPDRMALAASTSDITKRKLYSDSDVVTVKRDAVIGISAHNPKFGREDVVDRMLMFTFTRLPTFLTESHLVERVLNNRDKIWGGITKDLQRVLAEPAPTENEVPQFRITDFARLGLRIARALGFEESFRRTITTNRKTTTAYTLSEEDILIDALNTWIERRNPKDNDLYWSSSALWSFLEQYAADHAGFTRGYRNSTQLGKKIWVMYEMLKEIFEIEYEYDSKTGNRKWRINAKRQS